MRVTAVIKTFERPYCLERLLASMPPEMPAVIVDDSRDVVRPVDTSLRLYVRAPFDVGLSAGRNIGVERVTTEYMMLLDDDFVFTERTDVVVAERWLDHNPQFDLLGVPVKDSGPCHSEDGYDGYWGQLDVRDGWVRCQHGSDRAVDGADVVDFVCNCFVARTTAVRRVGWDPDLKLAEHWEFFWRFKRAGLRCARLKTLGIDHVQEKHADYKAYRGRVGVFFKLAMEKYGLRGIVGVDGKLHRP